MKKTRVDMFLVPVIPLLRNYYKDKDKVTDKCLLQNYFQPIIRKQPKLPNIYMSKVMVVKTMSQ